DVVCWDVDTGQELRRIRPKAVRLAALAFTPDGRSLLGGGFDRVVEAWDFATGTRTRFNGTPRDGLAQAAVHSACKTFSPDGRTVVWQEKPDRPDGPFVLKLLNTVTGLPLPVVQLTSGPAYAMRFSPDGKVLGWADHGGTIHLWDVAAGEE